MGEGNIDFENESIPDIMDAVNGSGCDDVELQSLKLLFKRAQCIFEWNDGPLVEAMKHGDMFMLDEISLADDSVLERLNSVLEPQRLLVLAEKATLDSDDSSVEIYGAEGFEFLATMNPGGDYGKKELSPALRNRFTEIWASPVSSDDDLIAIIDSKFQTDVSRADVLISREISRKMLSFVDWLALRLQKPREAILSLRDILAWANFITTASSLSIEEGFVHGGNLVILDGIGVNPLFGIINTGDVVAGLKRECDDMLFELTGMEKDESGPGCVEKTGVKFGITPFYIDMGLLPAKEIKFSLKAPTTVKNCSSVLRALQLRKPVLLEGSPGVGKTSLIENLAAVSGNKLVRINLSEQTDLTDLFGADLPVEEDVTSSANTGPQFAWRDGPFLQAMKNGDWVLLDELNLASQQVLEGLNACLDHRGVVYIPELQKEFDCSPTFRIFAAQNPQSQGGGRKGLPKSFVNRFTQVYVTALSRIDLAMIVESLHPRISEDLAGRMIEFVGAICKEVEGSDFGTMGGPWEFNLRDVLRWADLMESVVDGDDVIENVMVAARFLDMIFVQRMRTHSDREGIKKMFERTFGFYPAENDLNRKIRVEVDCVTVGRVALDRNQESRAETSALQILQKSSRVLESLILGVNMNWMVLLTGSSASGKTSLVRLLASLAGRELKEFAMNEGVDTVELLGGFEQADISRRREGIVESLRVLGEGAVRKLLGFKVERGIVEEVEWIAGSVKGVSRMGDDGFEESVLGLVDRIGHVAERIGLDYVKERVEEVRVLLESWKKMKVHGVNGSFEWIDGTLVKALERGDWVLIDNVNFCSPSVLDRLNPLMEPGGCLMINERGLVNGEMKIIRPHPDFRLFLTMDPRHGEISRAMRNRAVELSMLGSECLPGGDSSPLDVSRILNTVGIAGAALPRVLFDLHELMEEWSIECGRCGIDGDAVDRYGIVRAGKLVVERMQRGEGLREAIGNSMQDVYGMESVCLGVELGLYGDEIEGRLSLIRERILAALERLEDVGMVYPTVWPAPVDGGLRLGNSELGNVCQQASLMEALIYEECEGEKVDAVLKGFLKGIGNDDCGLLVKFLQLRVMEGIEDAKVLEVFERSIVMIGEWKERDVEEGESKIVRDEMNVRMRLMRHRVTQECASIDQKRLGRLSILQRSYSFHLGWIGESQLKHECEKFVWPLVDELLGSGGDSLDLLDGVENLVQGMREGDVEFTRLTLFMRRIRKATKRSLGSAFEDMDRALDLKSVSNLFSMWKSCAITTLGTVELFSLQTKLRKLDGMMEFTGSFGAWIAKMIAHRDVDLVESLVDASSTLYFLNENKGDESVGALFSVIEQVPDALKVKLDRDMGILEEIPRGESEDHVHFPISLLIRLARESMNLVMAPVLDAGRYERERVLILNLALTKADQVCLGF
jgi:MoxR-like ATPase